MSSPVGDFNLKIWKGDWGLPSIEYQSLATLAYCQFSGAPVNIIKTNNPWSSRLLGSQKTFISRDLMTGYLPVLTHNGDSASSVSSIFDLLRRKGWGSDHWLRAKESADILAYTAIVEEKLLPAILHLWWVDVRTFNDLTLPWYANSLPFPLGMFLPRRTNRECVNRLNHHCGTSISPADRDNQVLKNAKECLNLLSSKLGNKEYFFGSRPSSFDAIAFGILAPLMKVPFPNTTLQNHLNGCSNLTAFCKRILDEYFPLSLEEMKEAEEKRSKKPATDSEFPNKKRNIALAAVVGLAAMATYAYMTGIIQFEVVNNDISHIPLTTQPPNMNQFDKLIGEQSEEGQQ